MKKSLLVIMMLVIAAGTIYGSYSWSSTAKPVSSAGAVEEALALLPDSDFVALVDINQLFNTKMFTNLTNDPKSAAKFRDFEEDALKFGIDIRQLRQMAIGGRSVANVKEGDFYAIITGSFDREKMLSSIAANPNDVSMQNETYDGRTIYIITPKKAPNPAKVDPALSQLPINYKADKFALAFLNPGMVVLGNPEGVKSTLDVQSGKQPGLRSNQNLVNYITSTSVSALIRFAGMEPTKPRETAKPSAQDAKPAQKPKVLTNDQFDGGNSSSSGSQDATASGDGEDQGGAPMDQMLKSIRGGYGFIDVSTGFNLDTTLLIKSEDEAKKMYEGLNGLLALGKMALGSSAQKDPKQAKLLEAINQVNLSETGRDVKISVSLSEQLLKDLFAMLDADQKKPAAKGQKR